MEDRLDRARYALIVRLPRRIEVAIEDMYLNLLGTSKPSMGYHITLVGPFLWNSEPEDEALREVARICERRHPFTVRLTTLRAFHGEDANAVYLQVSECEPLVALHTALLDMLRPNIMLQRELPEQGYVPHVTLGLGLTDAELEKVMQTSYDRTFDDRFTISEIHLVEQEPRLPWRHSLTFLLEGQTDVSAQEVHY